MLNATRPGSQFTTRNRKTPPQRPPAWSAWASPLSRDLARHAPWFRPIPRARLAATLGARLGEDWTWRNIVDLLTDNGRRVLHPEPDNRLAYLARTLDRVLARPDVALPHPSRAAAEAQRDRIKAASARRQDQRRTSVANAERRSAAARAPGQRSSEALFAEFRRRSGVGGRHAATRPPPAGDAAGVSPTVVEWPSTAVPGGGLRQPSVPPLPDVPGRIEAAGTSDSTDRPA